MLDFLLYGSMVLVLVGLFYCAVRLYTGFKILGIALILFMVSMKLHYFSRVGTEMFWVLGLGVLMLAIGLLGELQDKRADLDDRKERDFWNVNYGSRTLFLSSLPDHYKWMNCRVDWYVKEKGYSFDTATRKAQDEYDSYEMMYFRELYFSRRVNQLKTPDREGWRKYRMNYWQAKGYPHEKAARQYQQETDSIYEEEMNRTFDERGKWMLYKVDWYVNKRGYAIEKATALAQQEHQKLQQEMNRNRDSINTSVHERMAEINIEGRAREYERQGYSYGEARSQARHDYFEDRMGDQ